MSQLEYEHKGGKYFAGAAVHTRQYPINEDGEMVSADESKGKTTCAWWIYGEQSVWKSGDKNISCMVQYSENTSHQNACYRYAELSGAYQDDKNECGLSGQYARFQQGSGYSLEVTWKDRRRNPFPFSHRSNTSKTTMEISRRSVPDSMSVSSNPFRQDQGAHYQERVIEDGAPEHGGKDGY